MKKNEIIFLGYSENEASLMCRITALKNDIIRFHAINGAWDGSFSIKTGILKVNL